MPEVVDATCRSTVCTERMRWEGFPAASTGEGNTTRESVTGKSTTGSEASADLAKSMTPGKTLGVKVTTVTGLLLGSWTWT